LLRVRANRWAWVAGVATIVSLVGYIVQFALDHISAPKIVGQLEFFVVFAGFGIAALLLGIVAIAKGRGRGDHSVLIGWIAIGYVALAQLIQLIIN
jgi:hypothetical protein